MGTLADATLTRIETLSANEALLQSRLGECVGMLNCFIRMCEPGSLVEEAYAVAVRSEAALRSVSTSFEARHNSPSAGQVEEN